MKKLYLIRHAKSSWQNENISDEERPLNERGKRDAEFMGRLMMKQNMIPDSMITSPAIRAITTAKYFCEELNYSVDKLAVEDKLYAASASKILQVIKNINYKFNFVMLFAHNPGLTDLANHLSEIQIDNIPTCGIFSFNCEIKSWKELNKNNSIFSSFDYPKKYFSK